MNESNILTTEVLDQEEEQFVQNYSEVKRALITYFNQTGITDRLIAMIEASPYLDFLSIRSKKFINKSSPTFVLILSWDKAYADYDSPYLGGENAIIDFKVNVIHDQLITPLLTEMSSDLSNKKTTELLTSLPPDISTTTKFILGTMFSVNTTGEAMDSECQVRIFL